VLPVDGQGSQSPYRTVERQELPHELELASDDTEWPVFLQRHVGIDPHGAEHETEVSDRQRSHEHLSARKENAVGMGAGCLYDVLHKTHTRLTTATVLKKFLLIVAKW